MLANKPANQESADDATAIADVETAFSGAVIALAEAPVEPRKPDGLVTVRAKPEKRKNAKERAKEKIAKEKVKDRAEDGTTPDRTAKAKSKADKKAAKEAEPKASDTKARKSKSAARKAA